MAAVSNWLSSSSTPSLSFPGEIIAYRLLTVNDPYNFEPDPVAPLRERLVDAAVEAEFETGVREDTVEEAKASIVVRVARITLGFVVTIVGIIAIPLPGPGWLIVIAGLSILARDFVWAAKLIRLIRRTIPGIPEDGQIPRRTWAIMGVLLVAAGAASVWYFAFGGQEVVSGWWDSIRS